MDVCVDCGAKIEDGYKTLCPKCHVHAAHGWESQRSVELMERFRKENNRPEIKDKTV